jgi:hypothetical protein
MTPLECQDVVDDGRLTKLLRHCWVFMIILLFHREAERRGRALCHMILFVEAALSQLELAHERLRRYYINDQAIPL